MLFHLNGREFYTSQEKGCFPFPLERVEVLSLGLCKPASEKVS